MASSHAKRARRLNQRAPEGAGAVSEIDVVAVLAIWGEQCFYCGTELTFGPRGNGSLDHLVPYALGGRNTKRNLVPACRECNQRKADRWVHFDSRIKQLVFKYESNKPKRKW